MNEPILPPIVPPNHAGGPPPLPPGFGRYQVEATDSQGRTAAFAIDAPNSLGAVSRVLAFLTDNLIDTKKIVIEREAANLIALPSMNLPRHRQ